MSIDTCAVFEKPQTDNTGADLSRRPTRSSATRSWPTTGLGSRVGRSPSAAVHTPSILLFLPRRQGRLALLILALLAGCGTLPPKPPEAAAAPLVGAESTSLAAVARSSLLAGNASGFRLIPDPGHALDARMQLIERAEKSIDAQYYYVGDDRAGREFLDALERAANRGVRVRLLVDDLATVPLDPVLRRMDLLPNMEVRLFNPFCCARAHPATRFLSALADIGRLHRRMHNKLLISDRALALAGGRNIGDEYFGDGNGGAFVDLDTLLAGDIVQQLGAVFERYWTSEPAWPAAALIPVSVDAAADARHAAGAGEPPAPQDVLGQPPLGPELDQGRISMQPGRAYAFADPPHKVLGQDGAAIEARSVISRVRDVALAARQEVLISSPYLVPRQVGLDNLRHLRDSGIEVRILTNSLAANDSLLAHIGYARYRRAILGVGADLYEVSPSRASKGHRKSSSSEVNGLSKGRLHTKAVVVDRHSVFIGSLNLDPRSADHNTELGVWIDSPGLAQQVVHIFDVTRLTGAYRVYAEPESGRLAWLPFTDAPQLPLFIEPESDALLWVLDMLLGPFVPDSLL